MSDDPTQNVLPTLHLFTLVYLKTLLFDSLSLRPPASSCLHYLPNTKQQKDTVSDSLVNEEEH